MKMTADRATLEITYRIHTDGIRVQQYIDGRIEGASVYSADGQLVWRSNSALCRWDNSKDDEIVATIKRFAPIPNYDAYLRFKNLPAGGHSRNYATGELEAGVSVYGLDWDLVAGEWRVCDCDNPLQLIINTLRDNIPAYITTGKRVGTGSDGEPLITSAKIIGAAKETATGWVLA